MQEKHLLIANYICTFGNRKLLDYAEDIVLPALTKPRTIESRGSKYLLSDQRLIIVDKRTQTIGLAGRIIKSTTLTREQIYRPAEGLRQARRSMESAPSATFLLILNTHKLIYRADTVYAPSVQTFGWLSRRLIRSEYERYIRRLRAEAAVEPLKSAKRVTLQQLRDKHPVPQINVIPISGTTQLNDFVERFALLKYIRIEMVDTNDELDNDSFFREVRKRKDSVGAKKTALVHQNTEGLQKDATIDQLSSAAEQGSANIQLKGVDNNGVELKGNNENFTVRIASPEVPREPSKAALVLYRTALESGALVHNVASAVSERVMELYHRWRAPND